MLKIIISLTLLSSCLSYSQIEKSKNDQNDRSVFILSLCKRGFQSGTGTILDKGRILTANHVTSGCVATWVRYKNELHFAAPLHRDKIRDIAVMYSPKLEGLKAAKFADVSLDDNVCMHVRSPNILTKCGTVISKTTSHEKSYFKHSALPERGNSGSAMYNIRGEIVGVLTSGYWCSPLQEKMCLGRSSDIMPFAKKYSL